MTTITGTAGTTAAKPDAGTKLTSDFNSFLKMLTTQLQNQDPLKPMDATQFTQQLVSFSQVEQQIQQTSKLQAMLDRMAANDLATATSFIGHGVELNRPDAPLTEHGAQWSYMLAASADTVELQVQDAKGKTVQTLAGETSPGEHALTWDGTLADGTDAAPGAYKLVVVAKNAAGNEVKADVYGQALVDSVGLVAGVPTVNMGALSAPLSDIRCVG